MSSSPVSPAAFARACVEALVGGRPAPPPPADERYETAAACFVSIKTQGGDLRGCIGTLTPCEPCLGDEIVRNAYAAAFSDPRFYPVRPAELADLVYSVDVLSDSEPTTRDGLDPARFGVIVSCGHRRGVLLPDLPTVTTVSRQVDIALQKAGISGDEDYELARFTVQRFRETEGAAAGVCWTEERAGGGELICAVPEGETEETAAGGQAEWSANDAREEPPATAAPDATGEATPREPGR